MCLGGLDQLLQVQARGIGGHFPKLRAIAQQVIDFMMKNQRQTGQRQQQQKRGANQAGPRVDKGPATDGFAFHDIPKMTQAARGRLAARLSRLQPGEGGRGD